jgi:putative ABC transport system substrate-binding protein
MTRGRCGSLHLHRKGLAPSTPCRSPGALAIDPSATLARLKWRIAAVPHHSRGVLLFDMRRCEFITLLGGVALACPLAARAQQGDRIRRLGVLSGYRADDPEMMDRIVVFRQAMQELGWSEGRNLQIDYRWAGADAARIGSYAAELTGAPPDVILAVTSPSVAALRQATNIIPIVFVGIGDPVGQGFVASLARPGGNITGFTGFEFSIGEKWLGFVKQLAPGVTLAANAFSRSWLITTGRLFRADRR